MAKTVAAVIKLVNQFSSPAKQVAKQAKELQKSFDVVGKKVQGLGNVFNSAGDTLTKGITAPVAAIGAASMAAFSEVDTALDTITTKTGAVGGNMEGFKKVFENVASTVPADMQDVGAAVGELNTRLGLTGKPLEGATEKFLKFSEINGTDVESSIRMVTRAMGDAGIAADNYGTVLDQLNVAGQVSGVSVDKLADNLAKYGAPMRALGIDTENSIAMFAGWEKAGVNTEIAFSGMKKAISNWGKEGKDSTKEFAKTLDAIKAAPDIASATSMAIEAFGAKAGPDLADAIKGGRFEVDEYVKALQNASGSVDQTFEGTLDLPDRFKSMFNGAKIALSEFATTAMDMAAPYVEILSDKIKGLTDWIKGLSDEQKKNIVKWAGIAAAIGPALLVIGKMTTGVGGMIRTFGGVAGAVSRFAPAAASVGGAAGKVAGSLTKTSGVANIFGSGLKALATGPIGIAVAAIAAGALLIYRNWDTIAPIFQSLGGKVQEFWNAAQPAILAFMDLAEQIGSVVLPILDAAFQVAFSGIGGYIDGFLTTATEVIGSITKVFEGITTFLSGVFTGNWEKAWEGVKTIFSGVFEMLVGIAKAPLNGIIGIINGVISAINKLQIKIPDWSPWKPGETFGINVPKIPYLYTGTDNWPGGPAVIHDRGGEIVDLPQGSRVYPHDESVRLAKAEGSKQVNINIPKLADTIVVREDTDIDRITDALARKLVQVQGNMA
jgi:TP901 family phage tail tape measure protein